MVHGGITGNLVKGSEKKEIQEQFSSIYEPATNALIYFSYLMITSEKYVKN